MDRSPAIPKPHPPRRWRQIGNGAVAGLALFWGAFATINTITGLFAARLNANLWWIDLRILPRHPAAMLVAASGVLLLCFGCKPRAARWRQWATSTAVTMLALVAAANAVMFWRLVAQGEITGAMLPLSLPVALTLALIAWASRPRHAPPPAPDKNQRLAAAATLMTCLVAFPLAQVLLFGRTDYRRPADAIVVLGARAYADGRPSTPLADRVRTACELYHAGYAPRLIFSGGPGDGDIDEPQAMRRMAQQLGVPDAAITLDSQGYNTQATVDNTVPILREQGCRRVLAVSHFFHLPRIKLTYQRAGLDVFTVPAYEPYPLRHTPILVLREVAALWVYYLRGLDG